MLTLIFWKASALSRERLEYHAELRNLAQAKSSHSQNFSSCGCHAIQTVCPSRLTVCCMKRCPQPEQSRWLLACKSAKKSLVLAGPCDVNSRAGARYSGAALETAAALASTFGDFPGDLWRWGCMVFLPFTTEEPGGTARC